MPLVRYEVPCEHSLANPDLYRSVDRYDSEGLLEGVAMGGLVGLVRQLGDLAEFAAEIFHGLHIDVMTITSRGKNLKARVARLEADLPAVERALLSEASLCRFAYTARSNCRLSLPIDQNLCAQGELPPFVRGFYDNCRGPPRLFLLDKFDKAGRGACVKRYTDPTYFRITWATAQLERAEQAERDRQAEQERRNSANNLSKKAGPLIYLRDRVPSAQVKDQEGFKRDSALDPQSQHLHRAVRISVDGDFTPDRPQSSEKLKSLEANFQNRQLPEANEGSVLDPFKKTGKDLENRKLGRSTQGEIDADRESSSSSSDDDDDDVEQEGDESKYFVDTLSTMIFDADSEADSRSRKSARRSADSRTSVDSETSWQTRFALDPHWVTPSNEHGLKAHLEGRRHASPSRRSVEVNEKGDFTPQLRLDKPDVLVAGPEPAQEPEAHGGSSRSQRAIYDHQEARSSDKHIEHELNISSHDELETHKSYNSLTEAQHKDSSKLSMIPLRAPEKLTHQSHDSISLQDVRRAPTRAKVEEQVFPAEARDQLPMPDTAVPHVSRQDNQSVLANTQQDVRTPKSRRLWARDNGSQVATSGILSRVLPMKFNNGVHNKDKIRARSSKDDEQSEEEIRSPLALVQLEGEEVHEQDSEISTRSDCEMACNFSSNASSPYTNISSSSVVKGDGDTSSASESSPKGPSFFALLSPPESPSGDSRRLMGTHASYNTSSQFGRDTQNIPRTIPFLSFSPTVSRSSSFRYEPSLCLADEFSKTPSKEVKYSRSSPQPVSPPLEEVTSLLHSSDGPAASSSKAPDKDISTFNPFPHGVVAGLQAETNRSQPSRLSNSVVRPRMWNDRSEHNVAATLRAIRQAAVVQSDDTGNEDHSNDS